LTTSRADTGMISSTATRPDSGSSAPFTHASWWLPKITHSSGQRSPGIVAITS